jgi:uncharacterized protein (TIGR00369 family)
MTEDLFRFGQQVLAAQPFSVMLGAQLTAYTAGHAEIRLTLKPEYAQHMRVAHGGIVSYAADTALAFAGGSVLGVASGAMIFTSEYTINYVKPARGELLIARAFVIATSARQAVCRCDVWSVTNGAEQLCAAAQGTIVTAQTENKLS